MKTDTYHRTVARTSLALLTGACVLVLRPDAQTSRAAAAQKQPTFNEVPGVTDKATTNSPTFSPIPEKPPVASPPVTTPSVIVQPPTPAPAPALAPAEEETKDKTLYSFQ